jgi:hypothetical protein
MDSALSRCLPLLESAELGRSRNALGIAGRAHVTGTRIQSGRPHFFVGHAVRAHDGRSRERAMQPLDLLQVRGFDVQDGHVGTVPGNFDS